MVKDREIHETHQDAKEEEVSNKESDVVRCTVFNFHSV